jgi:hypothetical protein
VQLLVAELDGGGDLFALLRGDAEGMAARP